MGLPNEQLSRLPTLRHSGVWTGVIHVALGKWRVNARVAALPIVFMPVSQFHACRNDPNFEERIQQAISGLNSGTYRTVREAADKEGVRVFPSFSSMSIN